MKVEVNFSPPYFFVGLYNRERREEIERSNRTTIAIIFMRKAEQRRKENKPDQASQYVVGPGVIYSSRVF